MNLEDLRKLLEENKQLDEFVPSTSWAGRLGKAIGSIYGGSKLLKTPGIDNNASSVTPVNPPDKSEAPAAPQAPEASKAPEPPNAPEAPKTVDANTTPVQASTTTTSSLSAPKPTTTPSTKSDTTGSAAVAGSTSGDDSKPLVVNVNKKAEAPQPQSFSSAFKAAREKAGGSTGRFTWNGKEYQTNRAGEKYVSRKNQTPVKEEKEISEANKYQGWQTKPQKISHDEWKSKIKQKHGKKDPEGLTFGEKDGHATAQTISKGHVGSYSHQDKHGWIKEETMEEDKSQNRLIEGFLKLQETGTDNPFREIKRINEALKKIVPVQEEEQLDELSKKTLGSYVGKAKKDIVNKSADGEKHLSQAFDGDFNDIDKRIGAVVKIDRQIHNRKTGIDRAKKLTKEETEQLDEISKKTVNNALDKAISPIKGEMDPDKVKKHVERRKGLLNGIHNKLGLGGAKPKVPATEEVELSADETARLDEISRDLADRYIDKAVKDSRNERYTNTKHYQKRRDGISLAVGKKRNGIGTYVKPKVPATEETELSDDEVARLDEISRDLASRYINKASKERDGANDAADRKTASKRGKGVDLALKKKWGDKNYGLSEPKVKATD